MADIIHFTSRAELDAEENLRDFVDVCRNQLTAYGAQLQFDENVWDITEALDLKAKNHAYRLVFSTWDTVNDKEPSTMAEPFLSFAKAYLRYQHAIRPTKVGPSYRLAALRALESALSENGTPAHPAAVTAESLYRAAQLIKEKYSDKAAYHTGGDLKKIVDFLANRRLMNVPIEWKNPIRRPIDSVRVGQQFDEQRQAKLPSPAALSALAKAFRLATEPADVLVSSLAAILCAAPDRINEVLHLEVNCEVTQTVPSTGEPAYGLRWRPSKGAEPMVKWVVASMADIVKEAISNIRQVTEEARIVAKWYESHPGQLYLPPHLEHLRKHDRLTMQELGDVLFVEPAKKNSASAWCRNNKIAAENTGQMRTVSFADVQEAVLAMLPRGFPIANAGRGLRYSDALNLILRNTLNNTKGTYRCVIELFQQANIANRLGARSTTGVKSVFDKFGFTEEDGSIIRISTHQFRHYLNTLAQTGGLSQLDIAKWSGRVDISQNKVYDHQSDRDILALVRETIGAEMQMFGPVVRTNRPAIIPRDEFARLKARTAHTTEFGYCVHDYMMLPCQIHRDCINCDEQYCLKGDAVREANIRRHRDETRLLLQEAQIANGEECFGSDRWVAHQQLTLERLDQLCAIFDDPAISVGAVIRLSAVVPASRIDQASERLSASSAPHNASNSL